MSIDLSKLLNAISEDGNRKYYVYRLVDPRTFQTFYVGKGCGDRVLQHVKNVRSLVKTGEDELSLKFQQIAEILEMGKEVIPIIHRRGMTQKEAFEVESALIDAYPGLTNVQKGHDHERGIVTLEDLMATLNTVEYTEPTENYIIIKTSAGAIKASGDLYEATRICWKATLKKAQKYGYVFSVINGVVREVYKVSEWYQFSPERIAFKGVPATDNMASFKNKLIPAIYRKKGASNPFLYKKKDLVRFASNRKGIPFWIRADGLIKLTLPSPSVQKRHTIRQFKKCLKLLLITQDEQILQRPLAY